VQRGEHGAALLDGISSSGAKYIAPPRASSPLQLQLLILTVLKEAITEEAANAPPATLSLAVEHAVQPLIFTELSTR
jgi:hypothetical protein